MPPNSPLTISVVTAVRNARSTIEACLESLSGQTYPHRQHVVVDGLSTDGTAELIRKHSSMIDVLVSERDTGIYNALNKGIARCKGDVVGFLHADDTYAHECVLAKVAEAFRDPEIDVVYGDLLYVRKANLGRTIRHWKAGRFERGKLARGWMPPHPTMYVRREIYVSLGAFDESYRIAADYDCILRIFANPRLRATYLPEVLVKMRLGGASNSSLKNVLRKSAEDYRALRRNRVGGLVALLCKNLRKLHQFVDVSS
jgi:glycosyltransferase involved in cell wall biosynthesis